LTDCAEFTDYFVLLSAEIDQHLKAIAEHIVDELKKKGIRPHHVEGMHEMRWILIDYIDVIVHIQLPEVREFYQLEALWGEAESIPLEFDIEEQETK
jgi:ribosome-associated protein